MSGYRKALRYSEEACQLEPENGDLLNTLGVAYYRVGNYEKALDVLSPLGQDQRELRDKGSHPADLAFLAMTHQQLGHAKEAQAEIQRLRERMKDPRLCAGCTSSGLPARSGRAAGKTQDARQQVSRCGRPRQRASVSEWDPPAPEGPTRKARINPFVNRSNEFVDTTLLFPSSVHLIPARIHLEPMTKVEKQLAIPEDLAELEATIERATGGIRDPEKIRRAGERMDRMREEMRQRVGVGELAVQLIREARDEG